MKTLSVALKAHKAGQWQTMAKCWLTIRKDGTVLAVTEHDRNLSFNLSAAMITLGLTPTAEVTAAGLQTYLASSGFSPSNVVTTAGLNVDTGEAQGILSSPSLTEEDLRAGLWDYASIIIFEVNWADLTMGPMIIRSGHIGEVGTQSGQFVAQWQGIASKLQKMYGQLTSPFCPWTFGDPTPGTCTKDLTSFTVTGTVTGVGADNRTIADTSRHEAGPAAGPSITGITNANPGVVTVDDATDLRDGDPVMISEVVGMTPVNGATVIRRKSGNTFRLGVDTSDTTAYPPYVSGGVVTPLGADAGYFDGGLMTFTSGLNDGLSMEVCNYKEGQWVLQEPMPYAIEVGDTYTMVAGCPKTRTFCRDTADNLVNFGGLPDLPGWDKIVQIGRQG